MSSLITVPQLQQEGTGEHGLAFTDVLLANWDEDGVLPLLAEAEDFFSPCDLALWV